MSVLLSCVARAAAQLSPFERLEVSWGTTAGVRIHTLTPAGASSPIAEGHGTARTDFSPRLWPAQAGVERLEARDLDPAHAQDHRLLAGGASSLLRAALAGGRGVGWFVAEAGRPFRPEDEGKAASLLALLEHAIDRDNQAQHGRRLAALDPLFVTVAAALDIRDVFKQLSAVTREALPHDFPQPRPVHRRPLGRAPACGLRRGPRRARGEPVHGRDPDPARAGLPHRPGRR